MNANLKYNIPKNYHYYLCMYVQLTFHFVLSVIVKPFYTGTNVELVHTLCYCLSIDSLEAKRKKDICPIYIRKSDV